MRGKNKMQKILVVYYTWSNGNTKRIAKQLQKAVNADIAEIETVIPYPKDYDTTVRQGQDEVDRGYMPEIKPLNVNVKDYDVIAIGTPTWWYTMAPAVLTFIKENDLSGKTVIPFMTNGGWPGHVIKDIKSACKGAVFSHEMEIRFDGNGGSTLETEAAEIDNWISEIVKKYCND